MISLHAILFRKVFLTLAFLCLSLAARSQQSDTLFFNGISYMEAIGAHFVDKDIALLVTGRTPELEISLRAPSALSRDGIKVSGIVSTDAQGRITDYKNLKVRGLPISLKSLEGSLTSTAVDVLIYGKALKLIDFKIHYVAGISEK